MSDRDGYDDRKPWVIQAQRQGRWITVETFDSAPEVIRYVAGLERPELVNVVYRPTMQDGNGESFLRYVSRRVDL